MSKVVSIFQGQSLPANENFAAHATFTKLDMTSINALAAYTAYSLKVEEGLVRTITASHFGVDDIGKIQRHNFNEVIRYLVDLNPKEQIN
jgi:hypothetical protein